MPWRALFDFNQTEWYAGIASTAIVFLVLGTLVMRSAPSERKRVARIAALFAFSILATFTAGVLTALEYKKSETYASEIAIVCAGISLIQIVCIFVFQVVFPKVRLLPPRILQDVIIVISLIVFGLSRLSHQGVDPTSIFTTSALITAVIGFSLQDTLGNLLGGLALQLDQSINVGDWVRIENVVGRVIEIRWRQTSIETNDWETVVVPNSVLVKNRFLVLGRRTGQPMQHRRWVPFYVDNQYSPDQVIDSVQASLRAMDIPGVAKVPPPQCFLIELAENPARYAVSYWLTDLTAMNPGDSNIRVQTYLALNRAGMSIAVPSRNITMTKDSSERRDRKWQRELIQRMDALRTVDLFEGFSDEELHQLAERLRPAPYLGGDTLVRQGAASNRLYIIVEGSADVMVENDAHERAKVAELGPGKFFGEMGLMTGETRTATIVAKSKMLTYRLDKEGFRDLLSLRPDVADQISTLLAKRRTELEAVRDNLDAETVKKRHRENHHAIREKIWQFFGLNGG